MARLNTGERESASLFGGLVFKPRLGSLGKFLCLKLRFLLFFIFIICNKCYKQATRLRPGYERSRKLMPGRRPGQTRLTFSPASPN